MTTKHFATIATESYLPYTRMLYHSLMQSNPDAELTVFCDNEFFPKLFGHTDRVRFRVLSSIWEFGVKRAKFDLYVEMCGKPFTYLDSDVIVLEDLSCLFTGDMLAGCPDTLEGCPFIVDREYPWPGDPTLQNRRYCNSGVLFFPPSMQRFLEGIRDLAQDDEWWSRYTIPGRLYDNHFLCAMLNRFDLEFRPIDPYAFGWSGLVFGSDWKVTRHGKHLIHQPTGKTLHLAIFGQGHDPDFCYARMPSWLAAFLQERGGFRTPTAPPRKNLASPMRSIMRWIESENGDSLNLVQDKIIRRVLGVCAREIDAILSNPTRVDRGNKSFFQHPEEFQELLSANNEPAEAPATLPVETTRQASAPRPAENIEEAFAWEMAVLGMLGPFRVSGRYIVPVVLVNRSNRDLGSSASISLSYHWRRADGALEIVLLDGERTEIHPDLRPGESRRILCEIRAPAEPGRYLLDWDLVEESVTWFSTAGVWGPLREVEVLSASEILDQLQ